MAILLEKTFTTKEYGEHKLYATRSVYDIPVKADIYFLNGPCKLQLKPNIITELRPEGMFCVTAIIIIGDPKFKS